MAAAAALAPAAPESLRPPVEGQVRDAHGRLVEGVRVRVGADAVRTDSQGRFILPRLPQGKYTVAFQKEGFVGVDRIIVIGPEPSRKGLKVVLHPEAGAVVEVTTSSVAQTQTSLSEDIVTTEALSAVQIQRLSAGTLNEAVDCNPGIAVQMECSVCNVRNVVLNNLPGRFTTILIEGVPIFSSVSGAYGLDMIGVNGVSQVEVSRGAGASLIAPEALAGTVNILGRRPKQQELILEPQAGQFGYKRMDGWLGRTFDKGAYTVNLHLNHHDGVDSNGNGVTEYSGYKRNLLDFGLFLDDVAGFSVKARLDGVFERRGGGALGNDHDAIKLSMAGNPFDWRGGTGGSPDARGWIRPDGDFDAAVAEGQQPIRLADGRVLIPYDSGRGGMSELIDTHRVQGIMVAERPLSDSTRLKVSLGVARHDQDSFYEGDYYKCKQDQYYAEASLQSLLGGTLVTMGLNHRYEDLASHGLVAGKTPVNGLDNYRYETPAAFLQAYRAFLDGRVEVNGSVRYDRNNVFGAITTPRLNLLWRHSGEVSSRFSVGKGFRVPTSFFEQDHGILGTTRIIRHIERPETSRNASYTFAWSGEGAALVMSANYNKVDNFALLDSGAHDPETGAPVTLFTQASKPVVVKGMDGTFTWKATRGLETTLGAEKFLYDFEPGTLSFARPSERVYLRFDVAGNDWDALIRATWTGSMDLARFYNYAHTPRFNMDGNPKLSRSRAYWVVDLTARWNLNAHATLVAGVNNLFNYTQGKFEDFLWVDAGGHYDVTHFWGPARGAQAFAGLRYKF